VTYYYRVPSTTTYYAGPGCASSAEPTPAPAPESPGGPQGPPPTYAPEGPAQSPQEQELRKPTPAEEQSGLGGTPSPADTGAPQAEPSTDQPDSGELPAAPQPMTNEPSEDQGQDSAGGVELNSPEQRITALPATPRTLDLRYSKQRLTNSQPNRGVARTPMPRWIPVANPPSVASR
jgi:hypothetical protein